jgi:hypothetical protein
VGEEQWRRDLETEGTQVWVSSLVSLIVASHRKPVASLDGVSRVPWKDTRNQERGPGRNSRCVDSCALLEAGSRASESVPRRRKRNRRPKIIRD